MIGQRLGGKYDIQSEIGRGGMGIVYQAYDVTLQRPVAIKVLAPQLAIDPQFLQRFEQEAVTAANLRHPNIVTIHDVGTQPTGDRFGQSIHYIVMEYLEGVTLDQWLQAENRRPSLAQAEHIVRQVADALQFAHDKGVIHRDVKPSNIMLNPAGRATLMDFGLVRAGEGTGLTRSGLVVGTPEYMAPEQAMGEAVDRRTDVYSFGVVIYKLLTGAVPFARTTPVAAAHAHVYESPPPLRQARPDLPKPLEAVVMKALAKDPAQRYQQANDLAADFAVAVAGKTPVGLKVTGAGERRATPPPAQTQGKRPPSPPKPIAVPVAAQKAAVGPADPTRIVGAAVMTQAETAKASPAAQPRSPWGRPSLLAGLALLILALGLGTLILSRGGGGTATPSGPSAGGQGAAPAPQAGAPEPSSPTATLAVALAPAVPLPASPTPSPTATPPAPRVTDTATPVATATTARLTSTPAATATPTATALVAAQPTRPAPTATAAPQPTALPRPPTGQTAPAPQLSQPADDQRFDGPIGDVVLRWEPVALPEGACYVVAVRFRHSADTWTDVHCLTETQMALPAYLADNATDARFEWQVTVMQPKASTFSSEADGEPLGPPSQPRTFFWTAPAPAGGGGGAVQPTRPGPSPEPTRP